MPYYNMLLIIKDIIIYI